MSPGHGFSRFDSSREARPVGMPPPMPACPATHESAPRIMDLAASGVTDLVEQLGVLDDLVFEAIAGRPGAMDKLREMWPAVKSLVGPALVEESREQYVRHALGVWRDCIAGDELRNPATAVAAMDVVSLLFDH